MGLEQVLIATITPLLIAGLKKLAQLAEKNIPSALLPAIAPLLGVAASFLMPLIGLPPVDPAVGAAMGLAGTGAREVAVKGTRAVAPS